jgi:hypothetical protein
MSFLLLDRAWLDKSYAPGSITNQNHSVDNSESSRNGDYVPSRWEAQTDAANLIFHSKTQANPESSVGLMSMGGSGPEVLTTLTTNPGKILDGLHRTKIGGQSHLYTGIMIASVSIQVQSPHICELSLTAKSQARPQAPPKQIATSTHHRLHLLPSLRLLIHSHQTRQEDEEEQHKYRYCGFR